MSATLRVVREARGLRREDLAMLAGVSYSTVANLEGQLYSPRLDVAQKIADVLNVPITAIDWTPVNQKPKLPKA